jgi:hypothetical protein
MKSLLRLVAHRVFNLRSEGIVVEHSTDVLSARRYITGGEQQRCAVILDHVRNAERMHTVAVVYQRYVAGYCPGCGMLVSFPLLRSAQSVSEAGW